MLLQASYLLYVGPAEAKVKVQMKNSWSMISKSLLILTAVPVFAYERPIEPPADYLSWTWSSTEATAYVLPIHRARVIYAMELQLKNSCFARVAMLDAQRNSLLQEKTRLAEQLSEAQNRSRDSITREDIQAQIAPAYAEIHKTCRDSLRMVSQAFDPEFFLKNNFSDLSKSLDAYCDQKIAPFFSDHKAMTEMWNIDSEVNKDNPYRINPRFDPKDNIVQELYHFQPKSPAGAHLAFQQIDVFVRAFQCVFGYAAESKRTQRPPRVPLAIKDVKHPCYQAALSRSVNFPDSLSKKLQDSATRLNSSLAEMNFRLKTRIEASRQATSLEQRLRSNETRLKDPTIFPSQIAKAKLACDDLSLKEAARVAKELEKTEASEGVFDPYDFYSTPTKTEPKDPKKDQARKESLIETFKGYFSDSEIQDFERMEASREAAKKILGKNRDAQELMGRVQAMVSKSAMKWVEFFRTQTEEKARIEAIIGGQNTFGECGMNYFITMNDGTSRHGFCEGAGRMGGSFEEVLKVKQVKLADGGKRFVSHNEVTGFIYIDDVPAGKEQPSRRIVTHRTSMPKTEFDALTQGRENRSADTLVKLFTAGAADLQTFIDLNLSEGSGITKRIGKFVGSALGLDPDQDPLK